MDGTEVLITLVDVKFDIEASELMKENQVKLEK
jgi:hypothetical protein